MAQHESRDHPHDPRVSDRPIDIVRWIYEGWADGDFTRGAALYDEASVFLLRPEFADAGVYVGPEQMERYMRNLLEPWEHLKINCVDLAEVGDSVIAEVKQSGRGELSGALTSFTYFMVWSIRGGTLMRLENVIDREQAYAAVGIAER